MGVRLIVLAGHLAAELSPELSLANEETTELSNLSDAPGVQRASSAVTVEMQYNALLG